MTKVSSAQLEKEIELMTDKAIEIEETLIPDLEEKKQAIEEKADNRESGENTEKELEKIEKLENILSTLDELKDTYYQAVEQLEELKSTLED